MTERELEWFRRTYGEDVWVPLVKHDKFPIFKKEIWKNQVIEVNWNEVPSKFNIGVNCERAKIGILDIDTKNDSRAVRELLFALGCDVPEDSSDAELISRAFPGVLAIRTPSGGWHLHFDNPVQSNEGPEGNPATTNRTVIGILTDSTTLHVDWLFKDKVIPIPPSRTEKGAYRVLGICDGSGGFYPIDPSRSIRPAPVPQALRQLLSKDQAIREERQIISGARDAWFQFKELSWAIRQSLTFTRMISREKQQQLQDSLHLAFFLWLDELRSKSAVYPEEIFNGVCFFDYLGTFKFFSKKESRVVSPTRRAVAIEILNFLIQSRGPSITPDTVRELFLMLDNKGDVAPWQGQFELSRDQVDALEYALAAAFTAGDVSKVPHPGLAVEKEQHQALSEKKGRFMHEQVKKALDLVPKRTEVLEMPTLERELLILKNLGYDEEFLKSAIQSAVVCSALSILEARVDPEDPSLYPRVWVLARTCSLAIAAGCLSADQAKSVMETTLNTVDWHGDEGFNVAQTQRRYFSRLAQGANPMGSVISLFGNKRVRELLNRFLHEKDDKTHDVVSFFLHRLANFMNEVSEKDRNQAKTAIATFLETFSWSKDGLGQKARENTMPNTYPAVENNDNELVKGSQDVVELPCPA